MTYALYDIKGYISDLGSTVGLRDFHKFIVGLTGVPKTKAWLVSSYTNDVKGVIKELRTVKFTADVLEVGNNLREILSKCNSVAIISDGVIKSE